MTTDTATLPMPKSKRDDLTVKLERAIVKKANIIAQNRDIHTAEFLSELLRPLVEREWQKELKKMTQQGETG